LFQLQPLLELAPKPDDADADANRRDPKPDRPDHCLPERFGQKPSRPIMGGSVAASSATLAQQRTQHHSGKAEIECRCHRIHDAMDEGLCLVSAFIGIKQSLHEPPARKAQEPGDEGGQHKMTEGLRQKSPQRILGAGRTPPSTYRCKRGKGPDNQEHDPARRVADPRHPFKYGPPHGPAAVDLIAQKLNPIATVRVPAVASQQHVRRVGLLASCIAFAVHPTLMTDAHQQGGGTNRVGFGSVLYRNTGGLHAD